VVLVRDNHSSSGSEQCWLAVGTKRYNATCQHGKSTGNSGPKLMNRQEPDIASFDAKYSHL
jgi:hypothetical protein